MTFTFCVMLCNVDVSVATKRDWQLYNEVRSECKNRCVQNAKPKA